MTSKDAWLENGKCVRYWTLSMSLEASTVGGARGVVNARRYPNRGRTRPPPPAEISAIRNGPKAVWESEKCRP